MPVIPRPTPMHVDAMSSGLGRSLANTFANARGPLLFGLRLWASVCLALYVAFWLQLDEPFWAATSAAVVCQPQLGASLRKGWFRMIGTAVGAVAIVVITGCFPQDRIGFFVLLALWGGICAFVATVLRDFASYAAALAGYTAVIVGADTLGATGGPSSDVFLLAVYRSSEIGIGIVCAGIVLAGTDLGGAQRKLAASLANVAADIAGGFTRMLALAGPGAPDTQDERRELLRRVMALDPIIELALGESSHIRYRSAMLQHALHGLFAALVGWRGIAAHLKRMPDDEGQRAVEAILAGIPPELRSASEPGSRERWMSDPTTLREVCEDGERTLLTRKTDTPSRRLLVEETAKILRGMAHVLDELALLVGGQGRVSPGYRPPGSRAPGYVTPGVADWLPAVLNGARAFVAIGAVELFWVVTAWPNGSTAIVFVTIVLLLLAPKGDLAYLGAIAMGLATVVGIVLAAIVEFAVLPAVETFPALCAAMGLVLIPLGFGAARTATPALMAVFGGLGVIFVRLLTPLNPMVYDTNLFYNTALGIFAGCAIGPVAFRLWPPLSPALRARRLLALTLRDLRRLAISPLPSMSWERRMYDRFAAMPDEADPLPRAQLLAALSVGNDINELRHLVSQLGVSQLGMATGGMAAGIATELNDALACFAEGNSTVAIARLHQIDSLLAFASATEPETDDALHARGRIVAICDVLAEHGPYFDSPYFESSMPA
jgi:uncharacterized membrane protein YccC